jgi:outer membrane protein assembly factor BamB
MQARGKLGWVIGAFAALVLLLIVAVFSHPSLRDLAGLSSGVPPKLLVPPEIDDDLQFDPATLDASDWVRQYDPDSTYDGYTLTFYRIRIPMIIDMNGNIVHSWPNVRATARIRLGEDGHLLLLCVDNVVREYDWDGNIVWAFSMGDTVDFPHHDLIRLRNGNVLLMYRHIAGLTDYLLEVDRKARVVWTWRSSDHLREYFKPVPKNPVDLTHLNSVQELPPNKWFDGGDERFRPGNLLISSRQLDAIFVIDRTTGDVVWKYDRGLDCQHEALMIPKGHPGAGNIMVFNNGHDNIYRYRRSSVEEINPQTNALEWQYANDYFFSCVGGTEQSLPNGNVFIASTSGHHVFEVTRSGTIVWEWVPPFKPMRAERYSYDHCPQLRAFGRPGWTAVTAPQEGPYVEHDLYRFVLPTETQHFHDTEVGGVKRSILTSANMCSEVTIPPGGLLKLSYGLDPGRIEKAIGLGGGVRFIATLKPDGADELIVEDRIIRPLQGEPWHEAKVSLEKYAHQALELCLRVEGTDGLAGQGLGSLPMWEVPIIRRAVRGEEYVPTVQQRVSAREKMLLEQQLKALGYME